MDSLFSSLNGIFPFIIAAIFIWRVVSAITKAANSRALPKSGDEEQPADLIDLELFMKSEASKKTKPEKLIPHPIEPFIPVQLQQKEKPPSKPRKSIDPLRLNSEINLQSGILFWQIIQPCPGMRRYKRFIP